MKRVQCLFGLICAGLFAPIILSAAEVRPLALHPDNSHYFQFRGKPTVLIGSGEHYGAVLNREFDYVRYLREIKAKGLNHTRLFSGTYREVPESFNITDNTLAPKPEQFLSPWARSATSGEFYGGNKFDLTRWDETFFKRLKDFIHEAGRRGIVVEISLFCPLYDEKLWQVNPMNARNNINGAGDCSRNEVFTLKHPKLLEMQKAVTRKFVTELNGCDNIYFEICNEPWVGGVTTEWQNEIIETIVATQAALPNQQLIGLNLQGLNIRDPHPAVSIFNYHHPDSAEPVMRNYALNKVIGDNETGFRGPSNFVYRAEAWDCILAGGGLFSHLDYSFSTKHPAGTLREYQSPGGGNSDLRKQFRVLKDFIHEFDFIRMTPDPTVIQAMEPSGAVVAQTLAEAGKAYAIYLRARLPIDRVTIRWTGSIEPAGNGKFTFYTTSNDGVRLWVNDHPLIDNTRQHQPTEDRGEIELKKGVSAKIRLEYYEVGSNSVATLSWSGPGLERTVVPSACLQPRDAAGSGLKGEYFEDRRMKQRALTWVDSTVDFNWSSSGPFHSLPPGASVQLTLNLPQGRYRVDWINPSSGRRVSRQNIESTGAVTLTSPPMVEDLALKITRR